MPNDNGLARQRWRAGGRRNASNSYGAVALTGAWQSLFARAGFDEARAQLAAASHRMRRSAIDMLLPLLPRGMAPPGRLIDCGANRGRWTAAAHLLYPDVPIQCFEPDAGLAEGLRTRFATDSRISVYQVALGPTSGSADLNRYSEGELNSLLPIHPRYLDLFGVAAQGIQEVSVEPLDRFETTGLGPVWIKIDVQGAEHGVLDGGHRSLGRATLLIIEISFSSMYEGDADFWGMHRRLADEFGFVLYNLGNLHREPGPQLVWGDAIYVRPDAPAAEPIGGDNFATALRLTDL